MSAPDMVVVGGGVIGWSVAWRAAQRGATVTVFDPAPGRGASWVAAGMLAPVTEAHPGEEPLLRLHQAAAARWPAFAAELSDASGHVVELHTAGTVIVAADADDRRHVDDLVDRFALLGLAVERCAPRRLRQLEPALHPRIAGGLSVPGDQAVDNRVVLSALASAAKTAGVTLVERAVARIVATDRNAGVVLNDGSQVHANTVVLAAGAASGRLEGLPDAARPPVRPVKGQILRLRDDPTVPLLTRVVRGWAHGRPVYLVPRRDGEVVVGATVEERGDDVSVTAGGVHDLLGAAIDLVPGVTELPLVETLAGLRPGTPDNAPILGPTPVDGIVLATGHFRHGILNAPVTGDGIAACLADGRLPDELAEFTLARFTT